MIWIGTIGTTGIGIGAGDVELTLMGDIICGV